MVEIGLSWLLLTGIYLALAGSPSLQEGAAALLCGTLSALWVRQVRACGDRHLRVRPPALAPVLPALAELPRQTARVGARLWRAARKGDVAGEDRCALPHAVANCPLARNYPEAAGACALSVLTASLSPDAYVLRLEPERGRILLHAFLPEGDEARAG